MENACVAKAAKMIKEDCPEKWSTSISIFVIEQIVILYWNIDSLNAIFFCEFRMKYFKDNEMKFFMKNFLLFQNFAQYQI